MKGGGDGSIKSLARTGVLIQKYSRCRIALLLLCGLRYIAAMERKEYRGTVVRKGRARWVGGVLRIELN